MRVAVDVEQQDVRQEMADVARIDVAAGWEAAVPAQAEPIAKEFANAGIGSDARIEADPRRRDERQVSDFGRVHVRRSRLPRG